MEQLQDAPPPDAMLRVVRVVAPLATLAMAVVVVIGLATAPQGAVEELFGNAWGRATVIDLYLALGALWLWIGWRERSVAAALLWGVLLLTTGSIALWGYITWRSHGSRSMAELLLGGAEIGA